MKNPRRGRPSVEVTWEDASSAPGWAEKGQAPERVMCTNVGILISRDATALVLAAGITSTEANGDPWRIPAGMVRHVRRIGRTEGRA